MVRIRGRGRGRGRVGVWVRARARVMVRVRVRVPREIRSRTVRKVGFSRQLGTWLDVGLGRVRVRSG